MPTVLQQTFVHLARYNRRANRELFGVLSDVPDERRKQDAGSYFGSIHGILNHILVADFHWMNRYKALAPDDPVLSDPGLWPPDLSWQRFLHDDFEDMSRDRRFVDDRLLDWFEAFPEENYDMPFQYQDSAGAMLTAVAADAFQFLFVHQIHHRGQVSQILDAMGVASNMADNGAFLDRQP